VSHNLSLRSKYEEFPLVQTPTSVTRAAFSTGSDAAVATTYEHWLRSQSWSGGMYPDDDYAPGWSWDPVTRHVAQMNAFIAFARGARFYST
jgi:hypothetical protein